MNDSPKKLDYLNPAKTLPAVGKAAKEAIFTAKDKSVMERVQIFFDVFQKEMGDIEKEKKELSAETEAKVGKSVDDTLKEAVTAVNLDAQVDKSDKEQFETALAFGTKRLKSLDKGAQASAYTGFEKLEKSFLGRSTDKMDASEISAVGAVGVGMLIDLKNESKSEKELAQKLEKLFQTSEKSAYPLKKLLSFNVLSVFNNSEPSVFGALLERLGLKIGPADLDFEGAGTLGAVAGIIGMEKGGEGKELRESFDGINGVMTAEQVTTSATALKKFFIPRTSQQNAESLVRILNQIVTAGENGNVGAETLAKVAYLVDTSDLNSLFEKLSKS